MVTLFASSFPIFFTCTKNLTICPSGTLLFCSILELKVTSNSEPCPVVSPNIADVLVSPIVAVCVLLS